MPIFALVIGRMVNTLGKGGDPAALYGQLNDTTLFFLYLAIVSFFVCYLEIAMWMLTGAAFPCMLAPLPRTTLPTL
jgi:ATP-binding cassette subfamily B (MDR/TAP) protein 1